MDTPPDGPPDAAGPQRLPTRWEDLTPLGRLVVTAGALGRAATRLGAATVDRASQIATDSARAFREGRDEPPAGSAP